MSVLDTKVFADAAGWIASWKRPLLISHTQPDGDALGSLIAMRSMLRSRGVEAMALLFDAAPGRYAIFHRYGAIPVWGADIHEADLADVDGVIVLDTCAYTQLRPIADWLRSATMPKLAVDHHVTRDELADHYLIDESAAAACLILYDWARALDRPMSAEMCEALLIGMATDTGWFRYSNTDDRVLTAAADLVARGANPHELYQQLYQHESPARVRLLGAALGTMELLFEDRLAVMTLSQDAIIKAGATTADTEDIVNEPLRIGPVVVSILLVEAGDDIIRASFRSKPPTGSPTESPTEPRASARADTPVEQRHQGLPGRHSKKRNAPTRADARTAGSPIPAQQESEELRTATVRERLRLISEGVTHPLGSKGWGTDVDVAKVAQSFGGGGHTRAAGARIHGTLLGVRQKIVDHLERVLRE
ncbi:MAG: DHH family phosphoesterase [Phycisphaerae bacterium]